jgi:hypothetical protein
LLIGLIILLWGGVGLVRGGMAGAIGAMVMVGFGLAFAGVGGWMVLNGLRQRGVL